MRILIAAIGRGRDAPEAQLTADWLSRASKAGRGLGLGPFELNEVEARKGGRAAEAKLLLAACRDCGWTCALDERGRDMSSTELADKLGQLRDAAQGPICFVIGGADGLASDLRERADLRLSLGRMVWPHMLARAMLAEQLYRATQILGGTPYHRA